MKIQNSNTNRNTFQKPTKNVIAFSHVLHNLKWDKLHSHWATEFHNKNALLYVTYEYIHVSCTGAAGYWAPIRSAAELTCL